MRNILSVPTRIPESLFLVSMEKQNRTISGGDDSKPNYKVKLMCSYGGKIQERLHDHQLTYAGGETKILNVYRGIKFCDIVAKLMSIAHVTAAYVVSLKYQLPGEDLDALVSVINDDDLEHMMAEYDRICNNISAKPARLRIFLFSQNRTSNSSCLDHSKPASTSPPLNPDFLFGFDKKYEYDSQIQSFPEPDTTQGSDSVRPDFTCLDPQNRAEIQPLIHIIPFTDGLNDVFSHQSSHVTSGAYAGGGQTLYQMPGYQGGGPGKYGILAVRLVPVYGLFPAMATAGAAMNGVGLKERGVAYVAADDCGRLEALSKPGIALPKPHLTGFLNR